MAWTLEFDAKARKQLRKLPKSIGARILDRLEDLAATDDPRVRGKALTGEWSGHWRYRIGDYRVIARIQDERVVILVVTLGHRREVYG